MARTNNASSTRSKRERRRNSNNGASEQLCCERPNRSRRPPRRLLYTFDISQRDRDWREERPIETSTLQIPHPQQERQLGRSTPQIPHPHQERSVGTKSLYPPTLYRFGRVSLISLPITRGSESSPAISFPSFDKVTPSLSSFAACIGEPWCAMRVLPSGNEPDIADESEQAKFSPPPAPPEEIQQKSPVVPTNHHFGKVSILESPFRRAGVSSCVVSLSPFANVGKVTIPRRDREREPTIRSTNNCKVSGSYEQEESVEEKCAESSRCPGWGAEAHSGRERKAHPTGGLNARPGWGRNPIAKAGRSYEREKSVEEKRTKVSRCPCWGAEAHSGWGGNPVVKPGWSSEQEESVEEKHTKLSQCPGWGADARSGWGRKAHPGWGLKAHPDWGGNPVVKKDEK